METYQYVSLLHAHVFERPGGLDGVALSLREADVALVGIVKLQIQRIIDGNQTKGPKMENLLLARTTIVKQHRHAFVC